MCAMLGSELQNEEGNNHALVPQAAAAAHLLPLLPGCHIAGASRSQLHATNFMFSSTDG